MLVLLVAKRGLQLIRLHVDALNQQVHSCWPGHLPEQNCARGGGSAYGAHRRERQYAQERQELRVGSCSLESFGSVFLFGKTLCDAKLASELEERAQARRRISAIIDSLDETGELPVEDVPSMEGIVQGKVNWRESELAPFYKTIIAIEIPIDIIEIGVIAWWIATGDRWPFAVVMSLVVIACVFIVRVYRACIAYVCPHCGVKGWCAEVSSEWLAR